MNAKSWTAAATIALASMAFGQTAAPESKALPSGHPSMDGPTQPAGALPPNHPAMNGPAQPAGALPSNHPSMADIMAANPDPTAPPATRPAAMSGSLSIQAIPGTAGAPALKDETVTVELLHRAASLKKLERRTDGEGKVTFPDIPLMPPPYAVISINHGGILQQVQTPDITPDNPNLGLQMKVFETTEEKPAWSVAMQHLIIQWSADGTSAQVTEMISATSLIDRAWIGTQGADNKRLTLSIPLPPNADQVEISPDNDDTRIVDGKLLTGAPLFPGRSQFRLSYLVPATDHNIELPIAAPAAVGTLVVFLPADDTQVTATGLTGGDPVDMGQGKIRMFKTQDLQLGAIATLSIKGIKPAPAAAAEGTTDATEATPTPSEKLSPRNLAMAGAFLFVLVGAALMLMKKSPAKKAAA